MSKCRVILSFPPALIELPVTYRLVKDFNLKINIMRARISPKEEGKLVLEVEDGSPEQVEAGLRFLEDQGIRVKRLSKEIKWDQESCVHCGACTAVCLSQALYMNPEWELDFDPNKCIVCELCVQACPLQILEATF